MKRIFFLILSILILIITIAPVFSFAATAPFTINSTFTRDYVYNYNCSFSIVVSDGNYCYGYFYKFPSNVTFNTYWIFNRAQGSYYLGININTSAQTAGFMATLDVIDLVSGNIITYANNQLPIANSVNWSSGVEFTTLPMYFYSPMNNNTTSNNNLKLVEPFVSFQRDANDYIRIPFTKPIYDPYHFYFADSRHFYMITSNHGNVANSVGGLMGQSGSNTLLQFTDSYKIYESCVPAVEQYGNNEFRFVFNNHSRDSSYDFVYYISVFNNIDGQLINCYAVDCQAGTTTNWPFRVDEPEKGIWSLNLLLNSRILSSPILLIQWSDTIDYSANLNSIISLLAQLYDANSIISQHVLNIDDDLDTIDTTLNGIYETLVYINQKLYTIDNNVQALLTRINNHYNWFESTYYNTITSKWDLTNKKLDTIISLIEGETNTSIPVDSEYSSNVENYLSQENNIVNEANSVIDSDLQSQFNNANGIFTTYSNSFLFIKHILNAFVFENEMLPVILISLIFGAICMILGKRIQGN